MAENQVKKGGAKPGHKGHGRQSIRPNQADEVITLESQQTCTECLCELNNKDVQERTVIESVPVIAKKVVYKCPRKICPKCFKVYPSKPPVLPRGLYGNSIISQAAVMHYVHGMTLGKVIQILGDNVGLGGLVDSFHRLGKIATEAREFLIHEYRQASVKHADETGWRNDGESGFAWLFATKSTSIYEFQDNRSSRVPKEIMGQGPLSGVLVVDRWNAYNKINIDIQYCYAHLLREVQKTEEEFSDNPVVKDFCIRFGHLLSEAMKLRNLKITDQEFKTKAQELKLRIQAMTLESHKHLGIIKIQDIFLEKEHRLYHWAESREIPAENNQAERELRPTVVARKVSFGSQSYEGAKTRSAIMSLLHTVKKRLKEESIDEWLRKALNQIAVDPTIEIASLIPPPLPSIPGN